VNDTTTSPPAIDESTVGVLRDAVAAASKGRLTEARSIAERGLASGADPIALNAFLGSLRFQAGEHLAAVEHLAIAHEGRPQDLRIAANLASALTHAGELERALEVASRERALADPSLQLARTRGYLGQMLGQPEIGVEANEFVVRFAPDDWASWNNLGNARLAAGDVERGIEDLKRAVSLAPDSPPARLNLARAYRRSGDLQEAERVLRQMADDFPSDAMPLKELYDLLMHSDRHDELLGFLDRGLERDPDNLELLLAKAGHLGLQLEIDEAEAAFRDVLKRDPVNDQAFVGLAVLYEHSRPSALAELADEAERKSASPDAVNLLRAFSERRSKRYAEAVQALNQVPADYQSLRRSDLLGQMLEKVGDYDGAFAAFEGMNEIQTEDRTQPVERGRMFRAEVREQLEKTTRRWIDSWTAASGDPEERSPVFLVGFPRSGTTLLDTILMGHPGVVVMEEQPVLLRVEKEFGGFDAIPALDENRLREFRRRYFEIASEYADIPENALLIDKSPMLLARAVTIHRLFPHARFILALRHPADVLLSCFVSNFRLNSAMTSFLRLDTAAELYDLTFSNWENARSLLPLDVHTVAYEQLVEDPSGVLRPLVEALGLDWHQDMLEHTRTAQERGLITTASYAQVTEPIYQRSIGRWRNYRKQLEPILPVLKPWVEKFGYSL
jgi:tetratricopeptide (TPR) repeat protein